MKEKGLVVMMVIAISVIAIDFGSSVYNVCAANITDHIYRFNYSGDGGYVATATRKKEDDSSAYAKNTSDHCVHLIKVAGLHYFAENPSAISFNDCTVKGYIRVGIGEARYLPNYVNERGYEFAYLVIQPESHDACLIKGYWSPDSI